MRKVSFMLYKSKFQWKHQWDRGAGHKGPSDEMVLPTQVLWTRGEGRAGRSPAHRHWPENILGRGACEPWQQPVRCAVRPGAECAGDRQSLWAAKGHCMWWWDMNLILSEQHRKIRENQLGQRRKSYGIALATGSRSDPPWVTPFHILSQVLQARRVHYQGEVKGQGNFDAFFLPLTGTRPWRWTWHNEKEKKFLNVSERLWKT